MFQFTHPRGVRQPRKSGKPRGMIVSIHAPARGATAADHRMQYRLSVSIHAPARGATRGCWQGGRGGCVSIHAPARGATTCALALDLLPPVSIHAPARGATAVVGFEDFEQAEFQFTHPRGVRHRHHPRDAPLLIVSIHAPARGATDQLDDILREVVVSIHAPARGATLCATDGRRDVSGFNSRTREGCDSFCMREPPARTRFQFTHPRGVRQILTDMALTNKQFQFTHPRGVRLSNSSSSPRILAFQFTHPRGVRLHTGAYEYNDGKVSIHAPARGATVSKS